MRIFMRTTLLLLILLSAPLPEALRAQQSDYQAAITPLGVIDTIIVAGNAKTKDYVILNEMSMHQGGMATYEGIDFDRARIYSLGLFTRVDIQYDSLGSIHFLLVDVGERWYLIPFPIFGFRDGDPKRPFYGFGVLHNNVGGRNKKLYASLALGYDPSLNFSYLDPLFDRNHQLYAGIGFSFNRVRNRSEIESAISGAFEDYHYNINGTLGKRLDLYQTVGINAGYQIVSVSQYRDGRTVSSSGTDRYIYTTMNYTYDSRDLAEYPSRGTFIGLGITKNGFGESDVNYARYSVDLRKFVPLPLGFTLGGRVQGSVVSGGAVPTYGHAYFGYGERIRGYFKTVFEGENIAGSTVELRYPVFGPNTYRMPFLPLPPEFTVWRFGISLAIFANAGSTWYRGDRLTFNSFHSGYGGGVHFLLPYGYVVRVEYAWNDYRRGEVVLDLRGSL
jgi:outer membrane protein assembly factor BamA